MPLSDVERERFSEPKTSGMPVAATFFQPIEASVDTNSFAPSVIKTDEEARARISSRRRARAKRRRRLITSPSKPQFDSSASAELARDKRLENTHVEQTAPHLVPLDIDEKTQGHTFERLIHLKSKQNTDL